MKAVPKIPQPLHELLTLFEATEDRDLRADLLIETAERFRGVPPEIARRPYPQERLVPACQSEVYLWAYPTAGTVGVQLHFAVENPQGVSARAMAVILTEAFASAAIDEILSIDSTIVQRLFGRGIGMGKGEGLASMLHCAQTLARAIR